MSQEVRNPLSMRAGVSLSALHAARVPTIGVVEPSIPTALKGSVPVGVGSVGSEPRGEGADAGAASLTAATQPIFRIFQNGICECGHVEHSHGDSGLCEVVWGCDCPGFTDVDRGGA